jgi:tubulin monoglycylase TTLL3/8
MLDEQFEPWLIEVNLSPACMERTNWLIDMLDRSAEGLFDHIEDKLSKLSDDFNDSLKEYLNNKKK